MQIERNVKDDRKRWELADKNRMEGEITVDNGDGNQTKLLIGQDEYLEWSVMTDPETEKIISVTFTCEGPEVGNPAPTPRSP
jgi:hypothetical protein